MPTAARGLRRLSVALLIAATGCAGRGGAPPAAPRLRPVVLPDLSRMERPVQDQFRSAYEALARMKDDPRTPPADLALAYGSLGNLLLAAEEYEAAEPCYLNAQALAPGDMRWPYYLGHTYRGRGEPERAAAQFEQALALAPSYVPALVWLGTALLDQGRPEAAEPLFARAASIDPRSAAALVGEGRAALARREYARAVDALERALAVDPRASIAHYPLALAYRGLGDAARAEAHASRRGGGEVGPADPLMQEIAGLLRSAVSYEQHGIRALESGDAVGAIAWFRRALELAPDNAELHHRLGTALSLAGDRPAAAREFEDAVRRAPHYAPAHFSLGVLLASSGRDAEAAERFAAAVRDEPDYAEARLQLAKALVRLRRYDEAVAQLREGARRHPERPEFAQALDRFERR